MQIARRLGTVDRDPLKGPQEVGRLQVPIQVDEDALDLVMDRAEHFLKTVAPIHQSGDGFERFGADAALPAVCMALASCDRRSDYSRRAVHGFARAFDGAGGSW